MLKVNDQIQKVNLKGQGGKEEKIIRILDNNLVRDSSALFDVVDVDTGIRYEIKKQADQQWIDPAKYYGLSKEDSEILFMIVLHTKGAVDTIATIKTGDLLSHLFTEEQIKLAWEYKQKFPTNQIKAPVSFRKMLKEHNSLFKVHWSL